MTRSGVLVDADWAEARLDDQGKAVLGLTTGLEDPEKVTVSY